MSVHVSTALVKQYSDSVYHLSQQKMSKLRNAVDVEEGIGAEYAFFDLIGKAPRPNKDLSRHSDTPLFNTPHERRRLQLHNFDWADLVDNFDKIRVNIDLEGAYTKAGAKVMGREMDKEILSAMRGTAYTGSDGTSGVSLPSTQIVTASAGMTVAKLRETKYTLDKNDVDEMDRFIVIHPYQLYELLGTTEVTSTDYNTVKALVAGEIDTFLGFKFITSTLTEKSGTTRYCLAWQKDGMKLGLGADIKARITERDDKRYSWQIYYNMSFGCVRMEEEAVVRIDATE